MRQLFSLLLCVLFPAMALSEPTGAALMEFSHRLPIFDAGWALVSLHYRSSRFNRAGDAGLGWCASINFPSEFPQNYYNLDEVLSVDGSGITLKQCESNSLGPIQHFTLAEDAPRLLAGESLLDYIHEERSIKNPLVLRDVNFNGPYISANTHGFKLGSWNYDQLFDSTGHLITVNGMPFITTAQGWIRAITNDKGDSLTFTYLADGRLSGIISSAGQKAELTYAADGQLMAVVESDGERAELAYKQSSRLTTVRLSRGSFTDIIYAEDASIAAVLDDECIIRFSRQYGTTKNQYSVTRTVQCEKLGPIVTTFYVYRDEKGRITQIYTQTIRDHETYMSNDYEESISRRLFH